MNFFTLLAMLALVAADCYLHTPRGSNNRYRTENDDVEVEDNSRLFDSQNNDDGGYDNARYPGSMIPLQYYQGSRLTIEWATQHACGKDSWINCEYILQYRCDSACTSKNPQDCIVRDGSSNNRVTYDENDRDNTDYIAAQDPQFGLHESWYEYNSCHRRYRNKGLFIADRADNINGNDARFTRQNNNGNRRGLECPEERDYYPYWAPSGWKDIAVLTNDLDRCPYYWANSQNTNPKYQCVDPLKMVGVPAQAQAQMPIDKTSCEAMQNNDQNRQYTWTKVAPHFVDSSTLTNSDNSPVLNKPFWGAGNRATRRECVELRAQAAEGLMTADEAETQCTKLLSGPDCVENKWARDNHLGAVFGGFLLNYTWVLPDEASPSCVFRVRYNMSSDDYDGWTTFSSKNGEEDISPVTQDPYVYWAWDSQPMNLALNTNQYGRTFQDRSHVFAIIPRTEPSAWCDASQTTPCPMPQLPASSVIHNVQVRGKRGLITQVYPSTTYQFTPQFLHIRVGDFVHFQWEGGSDLPEFNWGGGQPGTERHNLVQIENMTTNWPLATGDITMLPADTAVITHFAMAGQEMQPAASCQTLDSLIQEHNYVESDTEGERYTTLLEIREDPQNCYMLNAAPTTFHSAPIQFTKPGAYYYMSTRDTMPGLAHVKGAIYVAPLNA